MRALKKEASTQTPLSLSLSDIILIIGQHRIYTFTRVYVCGHLGIYLQYSYSIDTVVLDISILDRKKKLEILQKIRNGKN